MTLTYGALRSAAAAILARKLPSLAPRIYIDRQWPTGPDALPLVIVSSGSVQMVAVNASAGAPEFSCTGTLGVSVRVQGRTELEALVAIEPVVQAVLTALLQQPDALVNIDGFEQVDRIARVPAFGNEGDRISAQVGLAIDCTWTEEYPPLATVDLTGAHLVLDAIDPADPVGPYPAIDPFPAPAAPPRQRGPDGRPEVVLDLDFPT